MSYLIGEKFKKILMLCRYAQLNMEMSSLARCYDPRVPEFLKDKPQPFIKHCMESLEKSKTIQTGNITKVSESKYSIKSSDKTVVNVDMATPSCECFTWLSESLPCKHMFALLENFNRGALDWFFNLPWFNLDDELVCQSSSDLTLPADNELEMVDAIADDSPTVIQPEAAKPLPTRKISRGLLGDVQQNLKQISRISYLIASYETLTSLNGHLKDLINLYGSSLSKQDNLVLEVCEFMWSVYMCKFDEITCMCIAKS